jgi:hypothetical protein
MKVVKRYEAIGSYLQSSTSFLPKKFAPRLMVLRHVHRWHHARRQLYVAILSMLTIKKATSTTVMLVKIFGRLTERQKGQLHPLSEAMSVMCVIASSKKVTL